MLADPLVHVGASDGGAHIASFATYGDTGFLFSEFVRKAGVLTLEQAVKKITSDAATIGRGDERPVFDMPGDGMRYVRDSVGIDTVVVNGEVAWAKGAYTGSPSGEICGIA